VEEQRPVVQGLRTSMPEPVFTDWLTGLEQTLASDTFAQVRRLFDEATATAAAR
jgi:hypothetical protein